jgi:hypothetical protein
MAFNNFSNPTWVAAGADVYWWYTFGDNRGAQYAMANCYTPDAQMVTTAQADFRNEDGTMTYYVNFHNNGPQPCFHNLNGGGLT